MSLWGRLGWRWSCAHDQDNVLVKSPSAADHVQGCSFPHTWHLGFPFVLGRGRGNKHIGAKIWRHEKRLYAKVPILTILPHSKLSSRSVRLANGQHASMKGGHFCKSPFFIYPLLWLIRVPRGMTVPPALPHNTEAISYICHSTSIICYDHWEQAYDLDMSRLSLLSSHK